MEIVIASKNKGKIEEIKSYFNKLPKIKWLTFEDFESFPEVCEKGNSFIENAELKAKTVAEYTGKLTLADDSGLEVDHLGGRPGINSSRYAENCAFDEKNEKNRDKKNRTKLLEELKDVKDMKKRKARFICSMVLWDPKSGPIFETLGKCEGFIGEREVGDGGFGYDPIFIPEGYEKTMAQLDIEEKNKISHRGKALEAVFRFVEKF